MKTIDQVESRMPISSLPVTISQPGAYYLTGDLTGVPGSNGISITTSGVTLDLGGHVLSGVPGSLDGISVSTARKFIVIRNGLVQLWGGDGIDASPTSAQSVQIVGVSAYTNGATGIRVNSGSSVLDCVANLNSGTGILGSGAANLVKNCVADFNGSDGINMPTGSSVIDCVTRDNIIDGIEVGAGCLVQGCTSVANDSVGIRVTGPGSSIVKCIATASGAEGIIVTYDSYVFGNVCDGNGLNGVSAGILATSWGNRIDSNHVIGNDIGISLTAASNLVVRNSARDSYSGTNYLYVAGNSLGTITSVGGVGQFFTSNPWANFEF